MSWWVSPCPSCVLIALDRCDLSLASPWSMEPTNWANQLIDCCNTIMQQCNANCVKPNVLVKYVFLRLRRFQSNLLYPGGLKWLPSQDPLLHRLLLLPRLSAYQESGSSILNSSCSFSSVFLITQSRRVFPSGVSQWFNSSCLFFFIGKIGSSSIV